jgi:hypothetical protein
LFATLNQSPKFKNANEGRSGGMEGAGEVSIFTLFLAEIYLTKYLGVGKFLAYRRVVAERP